MRKQFFAMNRILVTGASGQLGTELRLLAGNDARFVWTDALKSKEILPLDICDADALERLCLEQDVNTILNMPLMHSWIFRRGQEPLLCHNIDLEKLEKDKGYFKPKLAEEKTEEPIIS